ncbi:MAG TPA: hypothetical protein VF119_10090 [Candidatus Limnocylindrales bacterium]
MTLHEVLDEAAASILAADAAGLEVVTTDGMTEWRRGGVAFVSLDAAGVAAAFRLDAVLAGAARRTPDTSGSSRGAEWVTFAPAVLDDHAADRAGAWFAAAYRRAGD